MTVRGPSVRVQQRGRSECGNSTPTDPGPFSGQRAELYLGSEQNIRRTAAVHRVHRGAARDTQRGNRKRGTAAESRRVYTQVRARMRARNLPEPQALVSSAAAKLALVPNRAALERRVSRRVEPIRILALGPMEPPGVPAHRDFPAVPLFSSRVTAASQLHVGQHTHLRRPVASRPGGGNQREARV